MSNLRIVIDGRMISESGIGRYIGNLLEKLQKFDKSNDYFILHLKKDNDTLSYHNNFHKILADFRWYGVNEQIKLPRLIKFIKPDLVHFPHFNVPFMYDGKFVVTIHDLIHQHFQMRRATALNPIFYRIKQLGYKRIFRKAIEKSEKILVPSNYVKELLVNEWKVNENKVSVTYEAVDEEILDLIQKSNSKNQKILKKSNIESPYLFYIGNAHPHKNVEGLIKAFLTIKKNYPDLKLVLAGNNHYFWQRIKKEFHDENIVYTGYVSDEELVGLYENAEMFIMPSFEEGFGIPILEAMACGCPVASSNKGSLSEVGGDACLYFDPSDPEDMAGKITQLLDDERLRDKLVEKGLKRCTEFSWQKLAKKTLEVYRQCA